jgi:hypothetical protein
MAGTVTGENAKVWIGTHAAGATPTWKAHTLFGMGSFSITFDRGTIEQDLIGVAGNYQDQGSLSVDGAMTLSKFGANANSDALNSIIDGTGTNKLFCVSANVGGSLTDATYLKFCFLSCQVTGYDVAIGDADTISEASIDFIALNPQSMAHRGGLTLDY